MLDIDRVVNVPLLSLRETINLCAINTPINFSHTKPTFKFRNFLSKLLISF